MKAAIRAMAFGQSLASRGFSPIQVGKILSSRHWKPFQRKYILRGYIFQLPKDLSKYADDE